MSLSLEDRAVLVVDAIVAEFDEAHELTNWDIEECIGAWIEADAAPGQFSDLYRLVLARLGAVGR